MGRVKFAFMKRSLVATTAALLVAAGCSAEADPTPEPETSPTAAPTSGAAFTGGSRQAETAFDEQLDSWLLECHDLLDGQSTTTHDISWEHSVSLDGNAYRLLGTATPFPTSIEFPIRCEVDSDWNVTLDSVVPISPRGDDVYVAASRTERNWYTETMLASAQDIETCFDALAGEYTDEAIVVSITEDVETGSGVVTIIGTARGDDGVTSEFWCTRDGADSDLNLTYHGPTS